MIFHRLQVATVILVLALLSICFWVVVKRCIYVYIYIYIYKMLVSVLMEYDSKFVNTTNPTNSKTSSNGGNHPGILKCPLKFKSWMTVITSEIKDRTSKPE